MKDYCIKFRYVFANTKRNQIHLNQAKTLKLRINR